MNNLENHATLQSMGKDNFTMVMTTISENGWYVEALEGAVDELQSLAVRFSENPSQTLLSLGFQETVPSGSDQALFFLHDIAHTYCKLLLERNDLELVRERVDIRLEEQEFQDIVSRMPFFVGSHTIGRDWVQNVWDGLQAACKNEIASFSGTVEACFSRFAPHLKVPERVYFHLVENKEDADYPFAFLATYSTMVDGLVRHMPLTYALTEYKHNQKELMRLLSCLGKASEASNLLSDLMESGDLFHPIRLTSSEAFKFLRDVPIYEINGIVCRIPNWWKRKQNRLQIAIDSPKPKNGTLLGLNTIMEFSPALVFDGMTITREELQLLASQSEGLAMLKGRWVEVDHDRLQKLLQAYAQAEALAHSGLCTLADAIRLQMGQPSVFDALEDTSVSISFDTWQKSLATLREASTYTWPSCGSPTCTATLRPYQVDGFTYLSRMHAMALGCCLADDMGLGKTVQTLALLDTMYHADGLHALLVLPASLIENWRKESQRFVPGLPVYTFHGTQKELADFNFSLDGLYLTTYQMVAKYGDALALDWDMVILDEAQAIKNSSTKQSKAVKSIPSRWRLAMTGTPIENSLMDLWSLFDFLNPGLLGSAKQFGQFCKTLPDNPEQYKPLKDTVRHFILRRMKTDRSIIDDLPDKLELIEYVGLSKKQTALYQGLVDKIAQALEGSEGIQRKGLVLAAITKFKQICNSPGQYLANGDYSPKDSGKFERLAEICRTIGENRERVLIFTQFRELCEPLGAFLANVFGREGLVLHGGVTPKKRSELVDVFNGPAYVPYLVVSVKAGGVGLNLTAANHVVHFDRWWNPAVENQATDRAFRIGQKKNVVVYKFVTSGTMEEKIDTILQQKSTLSEQLLESSASLDSWLTNLDNKAILDLVGLGGSYGEV